MMKRMTDWLKTVWKKAGFFIALAGCLLLLGGAAYSIRSKPPVVPKDRPMATALPVDALPDLSKLSTPTPQPVTYIWPVDSRAILTEHSPDMPVWSSTLFQWQPHTGIDIAAPLGGVVRSVADGTVLRAYKDPLLGNVVEVMHAGGLVTRYCSLMSLDLARQGDAVIGGQPVGAVGKSAASESAMDAHLHFEAYVDGEWADVLSGAE